MSLIRSKYRPAAIEPELISPNFNNSLSLHKKVKEPESDPYDGIRQEREEPVFFSVNFTQKQRTEVLVTSDEEPLRRSQYPTIHERIELQKEWTKKQLREAKIKSQQEAMTKLEQKRMLKLTDKNKKETKEIEDGPNNDEESVAVAERLEEDRIMEEALKEIENDDEAEEEADESNNQTKQKNAEYMEDLVNMKERKVVASRDCHQYHQEMSGYGIWRRAFAHVYGPIFGIEPRRDKDYSEILPWLLIGRKELSANLPVLLKMGITHILNVTHDVPNLFPTKFVYQRISVKDNQEADLSQHFPTILSFIGRTLKCQGRILVHCTAGSSRAPTAVIAYLVASRHIPLVDAYSFVRSLRPVARPNTHFLFQLAMLEVSSGEEGGEGGGCSVYYHKDWRFYEFNVFRASGVEAREGIGAFRTVLQLYRKMTDDNDLLA